MHRETVSAGRGCAWWMMKSGILLRPADNGVTSEMRQGSALQTSAALEISPRTEIRFNKRPCPCPRRSMPPYMQCIPRVANPLLRLRYRPWHRIPVRHYASDTQAEPEWFQKLRDEMLQRKIPPLYDVSTTVHAARLAHTLSDFLPPGWTKPLTRASHTLTPGPHLIYFNPMVPADQLLSDGTDALHSPGEPFVRRLWAGGSLKPVVEEYSRVLNDQGRMRLGRHRCLERIQDVQLRGQGKAMSIAVTIERRFKNIDVDRGSDQYDNTDQLVETRKLVFMKERTPAELEAISAGQLDTVRYLDPPGKPDISHSLTPTPSLLFRYSALTFNAHAIHIDPHYARTVEGHRNLLVHGPLTLTLILTMTMNHLETLPGPPRVVESIHYRNLAPLYCNEEMRLCARVKLGEEHVYEVWIEGPTGGMAFKGIVRTASLPPKTEDVTVRAPNFPAEEANRDQLERPIVEGRSGRSFPPSTSTVRMSRPAQTRSYSTHSTPRATTPALSTEPNPPTRREHGIPPNAFRYQASGSPRRKPPQTPPRGSHRKPHPQPPIRPIQPLTRKQKRRIRALSLGIASPRKVAATPNPLPTSWSLAQKDLIARLKIRREPAVAPLEMTYMSPVRYYRTDKDYNERHNLQPDGGEYNGSPKTFAFGKVGVRTINMLTVRKTGDRPLADDAWRKETERKWGRSKPGEFWSGGWRA
jgi:hydroxyacyl-ACP dehydratase HTD2-like protein with hotdog domain